VRGADVPAARRGTARQHGTALPCCDPRAVPDHPMPDHPTPSILVQPLPRRWDHRLSLGPLDLSRWDHWLSLGPPARSGTTGSLSLGPLDLSRWDHRISLAGTTGSLSLGRRHGHDTITLPPEAFGGFDSFSLHIASATAVFHLQPAPLGSAGPSPGSGELVCQGSGRTPRLLPSLPGRFQAPSSALALVSRNLFGERLPGCTSVPSVQKDSTSELSTSQENQRRGSDLSGEDKEEEQAGAPWRRALRSGARMHCV